MSAEDAFFLYFEKTHAPLHITTVAIFDGEVPLDVVRENLAARMHLIPRYRQKAVFPPFFAGHPTWEDDPQFTVERHVYGVEVPSPGRDPQLTELACGISEEALPRDRPLWDLGVVSGLAGGRTAFVQRVHHCMIDGVSAVELALATLDLVPNPPPIPPPPAAWQPARPPDAVRSWGDALFDQWASNMSTIAEFQRNLLDPRALSRVSADLARSVWTAVGAAVRRTAPMIWNRPIGKRRAAAYTSVSFQEIRGIRSALGGTVNDAVLTIIGGALGSYLREHKQPVEGRSVRIMIPVNVRKESEQGSLGNRVSMMLPRIPVGIVDPELRLQEVRAQMDRAKSANEAGAFDTLLRLSENAPAVFEALIGAGSLPPGTVNLVVTNVPGPLTPLYTVGHRMLTTYGLLPLIGDLGIGIAVGSYDKALIFCVTCDPTIVPDVERICELIEDEFLKLRAAAGVAPSDLPDVTPVPVVVHTPPVRVKRAAPAKRKAASRARPKKSAVASRSKRA